MIPKLIPIKDVVKQTGFNRSVILAWIEQGMVRSIRNPAAKKASGSTIMIPEIDVIKLLGLEEKK